MTLVLLIATYVVVTGAIVLAWARTPKDARVRYRLGLGMDGTTSRTTALVGYLVLADIFLFGGLGLEELRWAAIGGLAFTGFAGWTSMRSAL
jgi:hypothetical protein